MFFKIFTNHTFDVIIIKINFKIRGVLIYEEL